MASELSDEDDEERMREALGAYIPSIVPESAVRAAVALLAAVRAEATTLCPDYQTVHDQLRTALTAKDHEIAAMRSALQWMYKLAIRDGMRWGPAIADAEAALSGSPAPDPAEGMRADLQYDGRRASGDEHAAATG